MNTNLKEKILAVVTTSLFAVAMVSVPTRPVVPAVPQPSTIDEAARRASMRTFFNSQPIYSVTTNKKIVALTFDDGPSEYTAKVCNYLNKYGSKATFFFIGNKVYANQDKTKYVVNNKCGEIGNHTWQHPVMTQLNYSDQKYQIWGGSDWIEKVTGIRPTWFRPRAGKFNDTTRLALATSTRTKIVLWNVEGNDTVASFTARQIRDSVLRDVKPGSIILLHEVNAKTVEALPALLYQLKSRGYTVTTVSGLMANK